jgi:hypothetical protein
MARPYPRSVRHALTLVALALVVGGCGSSHEASTVTTASHATSGTTATVMTGTTGSSTTQSQPQSVELYLLDPSDQKLYAVRKEIEPTQAVGGAALQALAEGPDTEVPPNLALTITDGKAHVTRGSLSPGATAQVVYTLTQFPTVKSVDGRTRKDVEDYVPAILVEHPAPDDAVTSPLRVTGNANTFEATFEYDLKTTGGAVLHHDFVTATSGSGTRGTFAFEVPFTVASASGGTLVVYERSAENGSIVHRREIPLRLLPSPSS